MSKLARLGESYMRARRLARAAYAELPGDVQDAVAGIQQLATQGHETRAGADAHRFAHEIVNPLGEELILRRIDEGHQQLMELIRMSIQLAAFPPYARFRARPL